MTAYAILFTMAAIGIAETVYLIEKRKRLEQPICPVGGGCSEVLESKYNHIFGVHNDLLGLGFYISAAILTALVVIGVEPIETWHLLVSVMVSGGLLFSAILTFLQWRVIKSWCFWCLMSAGTVLIMFITLAFAGFTPML